MICQLKGDSGNKHEHTDEKVGEEDKKRVGLGSKGGDFGPKYVTRLDTLFIVVSLGRMNWSYRPNLGGWGWGD